MSDNKLLQNIYSKFIIKQIFSFLQPNIYYKLIKYNKSMQKKLEINFQESIINYECDIQNKDEILLKISKVNNKLEDNAKYLSLPALFCLKYSYHFPNNLNLNDKNDKNIFLIKYKGFKINDYLERRIILVN